MRKFLLVSISVVITLLICEAALRILTNRSGNKPPILDIQFPSREIFPHDQILTPEEKLLASNYWYNYLIVDGKKITKGDLWGILREDDVLVFTAKENASSTNGWWQSNNIGARSNVITTRVKSPGRERILIFGNSFAQSSRVPQNMTIDFYLNSRRPSIEAINFGVDGYGMAQSYLRFKTLKNRLEYDRVFMIFVPGADLERDINVSRYLGLGWFSSYSIMIQPRFVIENGELSLIPSPYKNLDEMIEENGHQVSEKLKKHLRKYDSFYFPLWHEKTPVLDKLLLVRLIKYELFKRRKKAINQDLMNTDSESVQITKKIAETMAQEVEEDGGAFTLIVLPTIWDIYYYRYDPVFKPKWDNMVIEVCSSQISCIDIMKDFKSLPFEFFDTGYDQTHYGPKTNSLIADIILRNEM